MKGRVFTGRVVSDKMDKTVVVEVVRYVKHPKYLKYRRIGKKYKAHDASRQYRLGDQVCIQESHPLSRDKNFIVIGYATGKIDR